jgi:hypothetical protein
MGADDGAAVLQVKGKKWNKQPHTTHVLNRLRVHAHHHRPQRALTRTASNKAPWAATTMADICAVVVTTCFDICAGILLDFASLRACNHI